MTARLVTLGESMVQLNATTPGALRHAASFERHAGGSESNVAVGAVRLGLWAGWISRVGDDEFGRYLLQSFRGEGVDVSQVIVDPEAPTGVYFVQRDFPRPGLSASIYYRSGSAASRLSPDDLDGEYIASADALHLTGITLALSPTARRAAFAAAAMAKARGRLVSFDTNLRRKLWSPEEARPHLEEMIGQADVVFVGEHDYALLWGEAAAPEQALEGLRDRGPTWVVLKRGRGGVVALGDGRRYEQPGLPVPVVDKTGAGDALAAAVLAGLLRRRDVEETLRVAVACAAMVCTIRGDYEGIPGWEEALGLWRDSGAVLR